MTQRLLALLLFASLAPTWASTAKADELTGFVALDYRGFWETPLFRKQHSSEPSIVFEPEYYHEWNGGDDIIVISPFFRYDNVDNKRTHLDLRELSWLHVEGDWELLVGVSKVFWGVTEVEHLVDIINQTDFVEDIDGEDKLGQPMVRLKWQQDWGTITLFALPGFRERTFTGDDGHFRPAEPIDQPDAEYESGAEWRHVDAAIRYSHTLGDWDVGIAHFWGTSREPRIVVRPVFNGIDLHPFYDIIHQTSIDVQATLDNWLLKFEGIRRTGQGRDIYAATGGVEYSFYSVFESDLDIGLVAEGMYDSRDLRKAPPNLFQRDVFAGVRLALNDVQSTEFLGGVVYDLEFGGYSYFVEASRRIGDRWKIEIDVRIFTGVRATDPEGFFRRDDHAQIRIARFF